MGGWGVRNDFLSQCPPIGGLLQPPPALPDGQHLAPCLVPPLVRRRHEGGAGGVGQRLGPVDVLQGLEDLQLGGRLGPADELGQLVACADAVPVLAGPGQRHWPHDGRGLELLLRNVVVVVGRGAVVEVLLVRKVAELVGGRHAELVVLERRQHHGAVLESKCYRFRTAQSDCDKVRT